MGGCGRPSLSSPFPGMWVPTSQHRCRTPGTNAWAVPHSICGRGCPPCRKGHLWPRCGCVGLLLTGWPADTTAMDGTASPLDTSVKRTGFKMISLKRISY